MLNAAKRVRNILILQKNNDIIKFMSVGVSIKFHTYDSLVAYFLQFFNVYNYLFCMYDSTGHIIFYVFNKINNNKHRT